jgi:hypothetical protein
VCVARSSTLETYRDTVVTDLAADTFGNGNASASRYLRGFPGAVSLLKACWSGLDAKPSKGFVG